MVFGFLKNLFKKGKILEIGMDEKGKVFIKEIKEQNKDYIEVKA